ncbi:ParB N-terminal domain-containing protein, partial [Salmonella enterica]
MMLKIEYLLRGKLLRYAKNSRTHSDEQVDQIVNSIREFGFTTPVLIDEDNEIIAGHGRLTAAEVLEIEK